MPISLRAAEASPVMSQRHLGAWLYLSMNRSIRVRFVFPMNHIEVHSVARQRPDGAKGIAILAAEVQRQSPTRDRSRVVH